MKIDFKKLVLRFSLIFESRLVILLILSAVIVAIFGRLTQTFYQQDEWNGLGLVYSDGIKSILPGTFRSIDLLFVKGRILSSLIFYYFATNFPLQNTQMAIFAIILHIIGTFLVFLLIKRFIVNTWISFLAAVFFAVNSVSHGAVTWSVIAISTIGSSIFVFGSILLFFKFLETSRKKFLFLAGAILYLSLWFKETGLYLFILFPLVALLFKPYKVKLYLKQFGYFILPFILIVGYRVLELRLRTTSSNLYLTGSNDNFFLTILIRSVLYPLTSFSLMFVPGEQFLGFAREVLRDNYPFFANAANNVSVSQSVILDLLAVILTGFIVFIIFFLLRYEKPHKSKEVIFWLVFTFLSFIPYIVLGKDFAYLESRYYYIPVAGGALLLSWLLLRIKMALGNKFFLIVVLPIFLLFIFWHINSVNKAIDELLVVSSWRKNFITEIKILQPSLTKSKNVFYITSDKNYWADGNRIPFQQGSGYTLMVLYYNSGKIPKEFLHDGYLFDIGNQGYKEVNGNGFGYFWNKVDLNKGLKDNNLSSANVVLLQYDSVTNKLIKLPGM